MQTLEEVGAVVGLTRERVANTDPCYLVCDVV